MEHLLVIDVGNTNTVMGIYDGERLAQSWRIRTERHTTEDEFSVLAGGLFSVGRIQMNDIQRVVISTVVPPMVGILDSFCRKYLGIGPHWVNARSYKGMPILINNPNEVGADRIVNAVAAYAKYHTSMIVIDFGTATTFDVISADGAYIGGAISPGIMIASEALFLNASKLPRVEVFEPPPQVVGKDTITGIQSGIVYGYAGLVDGMVYRMKEELGTQPKVIATGGLSPLMARVARTIEATEPDLTLEGLRIISASLS